MRELDSNVGTCSTVPTLLLISYFDYVSELANIFTFGIVDICYIVISRIKL